MARQCSRKYPHLPSTTLTTTLLMATAIFVTPIQLIFLDVKKYHCIENFGALYCTKANHLYICVALNCGCRSDMSCGNTDCKVIQVLGRVGTTLTGGGSKTENPDMSAVTGCGIFGFSACFARYEHETYSSMLET